VTGAARGLGRRVADALIGAAGAERTEGAARDDEALAASIHEALARL
jgi:NAD(P)-dependent dehydrogenase (short-subunit alcohol dehydrogenase family)